MLAGCAGMERRAVPRRELVRPRLSRRALQAAEPGVAVYGEQCERYGVKVDVARYEQGLREGRYDFPDRMM